MKNIYLLSNQTKTSVSRHLDSISNPSRRRVLPILFIFLTLGVGNVWGAESTPYSVTASNGALSGWTGTVGTKYSDGSVKFGSTGNNLSKTNIWSGDVSSGMTSISVTINYKLNGDSNDGNVFTISAVNSSGTVKASVTFNPNASSYTDKSVTLTIPASSSVTGLKLEYTTKVSGNVGLKSLSATATYSPSGGCTSITPTLTYVSTSLTVGDVTAAPTLNKDGSTGSVTYTSSNTTVATVASDGKVTAKAAGNTTITATIAAAGGKCEGTATANFTVTSGGGGGSGSCSYDLSTSSYASATTDLVTWSSNSTATMTVSGGSSTAANNYLPPTRTSSRFYSGATLTITPKAGKNITSIVFTATTDSYATALAGFEWTNASASATGSTVTVTPSDGSNVISAAINATCGFTCVEFVEGVSYDITAVSNDNTMGTVSITGSTITASPAAGYRVKDSEPYNVTSGTATVTRGTGANSNKFYVTASSDCTVRINFEALPTYAIRFFNNGTQVGSTQNLPAGAVAVKPIDPDACDEGYTFVGWWTAELDEDNTTAETWITDFTVSGAQDYYAVFSKAGTGGGSKTFDFATIATANSWVDGQDGYDDITISPINISVSKGDATNWARWWDADKSWRIYNKNTVTISSSSGNITSVTSSPSQTFSISAGVATLSPGSTVKFTSITVNYGETYYTTDCGSTCSTPTLTFGVTEVTKYDGDAKFTYTATPGSTTLWPGAITYTSSLPAVAEVNETTGEVTIHQAMSTSPVVITATMAKVIDGSECQKQVKATYTLNIYNKVTWMVNGEEYTTGGPTTGTTEGGEIETFPTDPNGALVCDGKTFMGWTTSGYEGATAPATLYTSSSTVHITNNTTFHAVFAEPGGESETVFRKITDISELTGGKRVLIVNNGNYALDSVANDYGNVAYPVIIYGGKITVNRASLIWTVGTGSNGGYYFSQGENYLNSWPDEGGENHYIWVDEYTDEWTIVSGTGSGPFYLKSTEDDPYKLCKESDSGTQYFNVSTGSGTTKYAMDFYIPDMGYTNYATSCCDEVESPTATVLARSTTATISWANQVEATNGYSLVVKEGETTVFEQTSIAAGTTTIEATGLHESTAHTFILTAKGATCNRSYYGNFTTTNCEDVPYNIVITPALKSATFKWTAVASTATLKIYSDEDCIYEVASQAGASKLGTTISGLNENTTYYAKIGAGTLGNCYGEPVSFTTTSTSIELAEWFTDSIRINLNADDHAYVIIEDKQEKQTGGTAKVADKLFFAKYFEGEGSMKLISIYNGTDADEDLSTYKIIVVTRSKGEVSTKEYDLSAVNTIYKGQEIIFFTRPLDSEPVSSCADSWLTTKATTESAETDNPRWIECKSSAGLIGKTFSFNGDDALLLKKGSDVIDCFGASSTGVTTVSTKNCRSEAAWKAKVRNMDYGKKASDYSEEVQADMALYGIDLTHDSIELATARSILFRDMAVTSGDNAVAQNTTTFATFSKEWNGRNICGSGTTGKGTCNSFKDLGVFDYNEYYAKFDSVTKVDEIGGRLNDDGTYTIPIDSLDTLACSMLRINVYEGSELKVSREYKVPIMVEDTKSTTDTIFQNKWHDLAACEECDVVILKGATLTKAAEGSLKDARTIRNLTIYPGGTMNIPTSRTFNVASVQFRVEGENVPFIKLAGTLQTADEQVLVSRRINNSEAYFFSLPYDCNISDIRWSNGEPAVLDDGFRIKEYASQARADEGSTKGAPGHWQPVTPGSTLEAGKGYQISVNSKYLKELIFPLEIHTTNVSAAENQKAPHGDNIVPIHQYLSTTGKTINNENWNFIAQPYLCAMTPNAGATITYGYLDWKVVNDEVVWERKYEGNQYLTIYDPSSKTYDQIFWDTDPKLKLNPFLAFFVQGKSEGTFTFDEGHRLNNAPARHLASQAEVDEDPSIFVGVTLSGNGLTDQANLRVRQDFTEDEYKLGYDLLKFTTYYKDRPQVYMKTPSYQLAFQAVSDSVAKNTWLPMGVYCYKPGTYTFGLSNDYPIDEVEAVYLYDKVAGVTTNLLYDTYTITTSSQLYTNTRFALNVIVNRRAPQVTTDIGIPEAPDNMVRKILINGHVYIQRGDAIYDITGKQMLNF